MIVYRTFRNADIPRFGRLWHSAGLGRGAAVGITNDGFDWVLFAQPYFDRRGIFVACDGDQVVGLVHATFAADIEHYGLKRTTGVICLAMVLPKYQRQGIGTELVRQGMAYLREQGAVEIFAGQAPPFDPFYHGLYGGVRPSGFLSSDVAAAPFFQKLGFKPYEEFVVLQRDLLRSSEPVGLRLLGARRATRLDLLDNTEARSWWWETRHGRFDSAVFGLTRKTDNQLLARLSVISLDLYQHTWQAKAAGIVDFVVADEVRQKGFGQALLTGACKRLREELISLIDMHIAASNTAAINTAKSAGFKEIDRGTVYRYAGDTPVVLA